MSFLMKKEINMKNDNVNNPADTNIRDEFAKDIMDVRRLLQKHGALTPKMRAILKKKVEKVRGKHPEIYAKSGEVGFGLKALQGYFF